MPRFVIAFAFVCFLLSGLAPAKAELLVSISKSQQRLAVTVDGAETYRWPVSTGARGHETPVGSFRPHDIERHWYSRQYSRTPMPWAMFFHRGYAVHGTMEVYNLGHAASHGCVRLRPDNAAILYSLMRRHGLTNTKVVVMNGALPAPPDAMPMADAETPPADDAAMDHFAAVTEEEAQDYAAKAHRVVDSYRGSVGSDEERILRERQAWLRSLDRKYGIVR
jgi:hypothetical protein